MIKCPVCGIEDAIKDNQLGILPGINCQSRQRTLKKPDSKVEFTSKEIKEGRKQYFKSTIQRYRDGKLSKEFIKAYPEKAKAMVKDGIHTEKEIKQAKNVWSDIAPMGGIERTK